MVGERPEKSWDVRDIEVELRAVVRLRERGERIDVVIDLQKGPHSPITDEEAACVLINLSYQAERIVEEGHPAIAAEVVAPRIWHEPEEGEDGTA